MQMAMCYHHGEFDTRALSHKRKLCCTLSWGYRLRAEDFTDASLLCSSVNLWANRNHVCSKIKNRKSWLVSLERGHKCKTAHCLPHTVKNCLIPKATPGPHQKAVRQPVPVLGIIPLSSAAEPLQKHQIKYFYSLYLCLFWTRSSQLLVLLTLLLLHQLWAEFTLTRRNKARQTRVAVFWTRKSKKKKEKTKERIKSFAHPFCL